MGALIRITNEFSKLSVVPLFGICIAYLVGQEMKAISPAPSKYKGDRI
jgi:hypothetical protein